MNKKLFAPHHAIESGFSIAALAPMVDIFTILVITILRSSSPEPPMSIPEKDFSPAISSQENGLLQATQIDVATNGIYIDGARLTSRQYWENTEEMMIKELYTLLNQQPKKRLQIRTQHDVPWKLTQKLLLTAQQAGYQDIELLALSNSSL